MTVLTVVVVVLAFSYGFVKWRSLVDPLDDRGWNKQHHCAKCGRIRNGRSASRREFECSICLARTPFNL